MRGKMSGKWTRAIAASFFFASAVSLCLVGPSLGWAGPAAVAQSSGQNSTSSSPSRQTNQPQATPPVRSLPQNGARNVYKPATAVSAADVQYPFQTSADGVVVFDVSIGARGETKKTSVLQDVPPFTAAAEQSLRDWKFAAATQNGQPEDAEILVAFVFRHAVYVANPPAFAPIFAAKGSDAERGAFIAPGILHIAYAGYPASTVAQGAVVVLENIKADGTAGKVSVLRDLEGELRAAVAIDAAKQWRFQSALRDGQKVPSKVAIAFVFSSRAMNPF